MCRGVEEGDIVIDDFIFYNPVRVYFGHDQIKNLKEELLKYGKNVLWVYGGESIKKTGIYDEVKEIIRDFCVVELHGIQPNPDVEFVREGAVLCKKKQINVILAVGGGSVIDASKWIAASACVEHDAWDFFCKKTSIDNALPVIDVLTIAATGSEMNNGGVINNRSERKKVGRSSLLLYPKASFLNPEYTFSVSQYQTACGAVDILSHVMEVYFHRCCPFDMLDGIMESMMFTVITNGIIAYEEPRNYNARANLMWAASWAINGFISGGVRQAWNCHTIEHELSARYEITHGHGLAIIIPVWLEYCYSDETKQRYYKFAKNVLEIREETLVGVNVAKVISNSLRKIFFETFHLNPRLRTFGITEDDLFLISQSICEKGNVDGFVNLGKDDVINILKKCL